MGDTNTMTREQELAEEFKAGVSPDDVPQLATRIAALEAERDAAVKRADKAEKARDKAKVSAGEKPARARKLGEMDDGFADTSDLADKIAKADKVEIVFSDGKHELTDVVPFVVEGTAWRETPNGLMLNEPLTVHGPGQGQAAYQIDGYALLLDGKQVAYRKRPDPVTVVPGQTYKIENDIIF